MLLSFMAEHARQKTRQQELTNNANLQPAANSSFNSPLQQLPSHSQQQDIVNTLQKLESIPSVAPPITGKVQSNAAREFSSILERNISNALENQNAPKPPNASEIASEPQQPAEILPSPASKRRILRRPDMSSSTSKPTPAPKTQEEVAIRSSKRETRKPDRLQVSEVEEAQDFTPIEQLD